MEIISIKKLKPNPENPRTIRDEKFEKLCRSITDFPQMLELRPIVVDEDYMVLGGNMRLRALQHLKHSKVYVTIAEGLTAEQKREFVIKDNVGFGDWDWDSLANSWDTMQLEEWGLDVPNFAPDVDYSILDDDDVESQLSDMTNGVKKAIQIEFKAEHYEEAYALVKFWREKEAYVGGMIMEYLKAEKEKI